MTTTNPGAAKKAAIPAAPPTTTDRRLAELEIANEDNIAVLNQLLRRISEMAAIVKLIPANPIMANALAEIENRPLHIPSRERAAAKERADAEAEAGANLAAALPGAKPNPNKGSNR